MEYIDINLLHPHPKNPREDVGDVSELAESIKANGIMQNLTVNDNDDGTYTVIIGHRRLAATKLAGLTEVPCQVVHMDNATQQSIMLLENMQRIDLTPYEQAQGFQMCLDLGITEDDLKKKTGFSKKTIRHRLKLLDLDKEKFKKGVERGGTLQDYIDLEQIENSKIKDQLLTMIGTTDYRFKLNSELTIQKDKKAKDEFLNKLNQCMKKVSKKPEGYEYAAYIYGNIQMRNYVIPDDLKERNYVYIMHNGNIIEIYKEVLETEKQVISKVTMNQPTKEDIAIEQIKSKVEASYKTRLEFAKEIYTTLPINIKNNIETRYAFYLLSNVMNYYRYDDEVFMDVTGTEIDDIKAKEDPGFSSMISAHRLLFALIYATLEITDDESTTHIYKNTINYGAYNGAYKNEIKELYDFLGQYGYQPSEEETAIMFGTHELYAKRTEGE